jgi:hypothetical protein
MAHSTNTAILQIFEGEKNGMNPVAQNRRLLFASLEFIGGLAWRVSLLNGNLASQSQAVFIAASQSSNQKND